MSTKNPLHEFSSWSYKHFLIGCDSTEVAKFLASPDSSFLNDVLSGDYPDLYVHDIAGKGKFVVGINGYKSARYFFESVEWQSMFMPPFSSNTREYDHLTSMALEGKLNIREPKGVILLNVMNEIGKALNTGPNGTVWMLKTVFVGHKNDKPGIDFRISNIKPLLFHIIDIQAEFSNDGGKYDISFVGNVNGVSKAPHINTINVKHIHLQSEHSTIGSALNLLTDTINDQYENELFEVDNLAKQKNIELKGRKLRYVIEAPEYVDYVIDNTQILNKETGSDIGYVNFGMKPSIEYMIRKIMELSSEVQSESKRSADDSAASSVFKIHTSMDTTTTEVVVKYLVRRWEYPEADPSDIQKLTITDETNYLEYNYLYTGKNIDIQNFDIKMEYGLAFFQMLALTPSTTDDRKQHDVNKTESINTSQGDNTRVVDLGIRYPNANIQSSMRKFYKNYDGVSNFFSALDKIATIENLGVSMDIIGNPLLLNDLAITSDDLSNDEISGSEILSNFHKSMPLCKVNISMPNNNSTYGLSEDGVFQRKFWYDGYYAIFGITNRFDDEGGFTQTLEMMSVPTEDLFTSKDTSVIQTTQTGKTANA